MSWFSSHVKEKIQDTCKQFDLRKFSSVRKHTLVLIWGRVVHGTVRGASVRQFSGTVAQPVKDTQLVLTASLLRSVAVSRTVVTN